ncbi:hypothetical protein [Estrella lausannensis]|uniref:Uncharacterized protein n=1 Tax=Estrella lausannensis TaxID=483423 RepID=A0A0H5DRQ0_9BACT|nr:hypothetical protein [Estrella lausannensis]CRX39386.1 hypothetical protein ELAC_2065 [Estrella lausannensis]
MYVPRTADGPLQKPSQNESKNPAGISSNPWNIQKGPKNEDAQPAKETILFGSHASVPPSQPMRGNARAASTSSQRNLNEKEYPTLSESHNKPSPIRKCKSAATAPKEAVTTPKDKKPFSWDDLKKSETNSPAKTATPLGCKKVEKKHESDLNLATEIVGDSDSWSTGAITGKAISLKELTDEDSSTQQFFRVSGRKKAKSTESKANTLLMRYINEMASKGNTSFPKRYVEKREKYLKECTNEYTPSHETWEDAMRHDPPLAMLQHLNKIKYIITTYQSDHLKTPLIQFIFPCAITIPSERHYVFESLTTNSATMCLELSLSSEHAKPLHVFIRPLNRKVPQEAELAEKMEIPHRTLLLTEMLSDVINNSHATQLSSKNLVNETSGHFEFFSIYGAHIKVEKK